MNERIKELANQSYIKDEYGVPLFDHQKFAELIVRECIEVGSKAFCKDNRIVSIFPANQIKEHFGVE